MTMTPQEFAERMREIFPDEYDHSAAHEVADRLMVDTLSDLGYHVGVGVFIDANIYYD